MSVLSRAAARVPKVPLPGVTWAVRTWLQRSFGDPPVGSDGPAGDLGLLGPASASWQLFSDVASIVGGIRSLLVQLTHPLAMAGVADHSRYLDEPLGRLQGTSAYFGLVTFGSTQQALDVTRRVRGLHRRVVGHAPDGRPYDAASPELLSWVSVTATASFLRSDLEFATRPLRPAQRDQFVAEQARIAGLLDPRVDLDAWAGDRLPLVAEGWLPTTEAELDERLRWFSPQLAVGQQGRTCLQFLLWPPVAPAMRVGYLPALGGALGTLEPSTRRLLGLPFGDVTARAMRLQAELTLVGLRAAVARPSPNLEAARERTARQAAA